MLSSNHSNVVATAVNYIEDVFSTYLYTGNSSTQTITNGIDLSGKGGMVWIKCRNTATTDNAVVDSARGSQNILVPNRTNASGPNDAVDAFTSTGFSLTNDTEYVNANTQTYVSWTFRKQPKFFDIQTWTGDGSNRTISHALGSVPACIMVKRTDSAGAWQVYHRSLANTDYLVLNTTAASATDATRWNSTTPTSTEFSLGTDATVNSSASGATYVAYIFAHDAGGFGLTGTDNVISCGSFTTNGSGNATVSLGYEPQFVLYKKSSTTGQWYIEDTMRGLYAPTTLGATLIANLSSAESATNGSLWLNSTGFTVNPSGNLGTSTTCIYIAIRRGPMAVPTTGTSVFQPITASSSSTIETTTATFPLDMQFNTFTNSSSATYNSQINDRLRGIGFAPSFTTTPHLTTASVVAESTSSTFLAFKGNGMDVTKSDGWGAATAVFYNFRRAPSFFDEVCFTGTGVAGATFNHNLGVVPELMIVKKRSGTTAAWYVYASDLGNTKYILLNETAASVTSSTLWNNTSPTASVFSLGSSAAVNDGNDCVNYLFATCAGVSKVGGYTGTGTTLQIDCGFTAGARFILIKRTDSTGGWYVWDTARGIVSGNDPYLLINSTAAEVTSTDYIDTYAAGFEISSTAPAAINASAGTFVFLAIA